MTLSPEPLQEQTAVVLWWGMSLASWLLAQGERGGHGDLRGSGRLSVIVTPRVSNPHDYINHIFKRP
jgi:hypothetical protein